MFSVEEQGHAKRCGAGKDGNRQGDIGLEERVREPVDDIGNIDTGKDEAQRRLDPGQDTGSQDGGVGGDLVDAPGTEDEDAKGRDDGEEDVGESESNVGLVLE